MKIGIDFDGVILDTERALKFYADYYSFFELDKKKRLRSNSVNQRECFDWTDEEYKNYFKKYYVLASKTAPFITGVKEILQKLKAQGHELYIVSSRHIAMFDEPALAMERLKELDVEFDGFSFEDGKKAERCKKLGIDIMVDDNPDNVKEFIGTNIRVLYFRDVKIERVFAENVKRVDSWVDVYFEANKIEYR